MRSRRLLIALGLLLIGQIAMAGDLYLVGIENPGQLESLKELAGHAHGMIGERFLVELSADQASQLADNGILAERILSDYSGERLFLVRSTDPERKPLPEGIEAIFSSKEEFLTRPDYAGLERLRRDRFNVYAVGDMETPLFYHPVSIPGPLLDSYPTDTIANLVSQDSLYSYTSRMEAFRTRCVLSDSIGPVMEWLIDKFQEFGYNNVYPDYCSGINQWNGQFTSGYNVVCIKPGRIQPPKYIMVGAHYDSYTWYPVENRENAPGADDNATGTAAVLEMARVLKDVELDYSIMFVPFWGEEIGLLGSKYLGQKLLAEGTKVEFVTNMDMIAYTYDAVDSAIINYPASSKDFGLVYRSASERISQLPSYSSTDHLGSDDYALHDLGYQTTGICEADIHHNNFIHHVYDSTTRLDFPYMTSMVRFIVAGLAVIAKAPESPAFTLQDFGDGQRIRIHISDCNPDYSYSVLYGTASGVYTDTIDIPPQTCTYDLGELTTGQIYHVGLVAVNGEGYSSIRIVEKTMIPRTVPLAPYLISAIPDSLSANITWRKNSELDIKEYHVVRTSNMIDWEVGAVCTDTTYHDVDVIPHTITWYKVIAVDSALNQSDSSGINQATPATFDWPLLFVDETNAGGINPTEFMQKAFYDSILTGLTYTQMNVDTINQSPTRCDFGQYENIFWIDDDNANHYFGSEVYAADWYLKYATNMLLAGWKTIHTITGPSYLYAGNFFYDHMGLTKVEINNMPNFIGADGATGWPDLELRQGEPLYGQLSDITIFEKAADAEVIYAYRSNMPGSYYDGRPVGVAYNTGFGKRVVLGFPLYQLTETSAQALVQKVLAYFAEPTPHYGDVNHDGRVNIQDITFLINYLYKGGPAPSVLNDADANGDCSINIRDITYLIKYLYQGGAAPVMGCISM